MVPVPIFRRILRAICVKSALYGIYNFKHSFSGSIFAEKDIYAGFYGEAFLNSPPRPYLNGLA